MQTKHADPILEIKALSGNGEIEGYGSTFGGEPDSAGDVIAPGAYADSLRAHASKGTMPKMLWQHERGEVIGRWTAAQEDEKGLLLRGKLNMDVQRGREAYALLKDGAIDGLSIGYRIKEYSVDTETGVWTLEKLDLFEVSVVTIGANENATINSVKAMKAAHDLVERLKAGERLTEREFEMMLKGALGFSNSQAERAARLCLKGQGEPVEAASAADFASAFQALMG